MHANSEWLSQGDVFARVPVLELVPDPTSPLGVRAEGLALVPALLITHGCELDKRTGAGKSKANFLHFLPLRAMSVQDQNLQVVLRREELNPAAAMLVGEVPGIGEALVNMAEVVRIPSTYLAPTLKAPDDSTAGPEDLYLYPTANDSRLGTLTKEQQGLLQDKLAAYWARIRRTPQS